MNITEQITIAAPLGEVWPLLSDPALVAGCIPGAQLAPGQADGVWRGAIRVKFGPTTASFRGEATLEYDHATHRCTIEGRGIDQRGASRALSSGVIVASEQDGRTLLAIDGSFTVTGPLENFANAGGVHLARVLLAEFAANIAALVAERRGAATPASAEAATPTSGAVPIPAAASKPPPAPPVAQELNVLDLLWRMLASWLRGLFGRRKG